MTLILFIDGVLYLSSQFLAFVERLINYYLSLADLLLALHKTAQQGETQAYVYALIGIRTYDSSVRAFQDRRCNVVNISI